MIVGGIKWMVLDKHLRWMCLHLCSTRWERGTNVLRMAVRLWRQYISHIPVKRSISILVVAVTLSGCADFAEREADRQVTALVKDRQQKTLGYKPEVVAPVDHKDVLPTTPRVREDSADASASGDQGAGGAATRCFGVWGAGAKAI